MASTTQLCRHFPSSTLSQSLPSLSSILTIRSAHPLLSINNAKYTTNTPPASGKALLPSSLATSTSTIANRFTHGSVNRLFGISSTNMCAQSVRWMSTIAPSEATADAFAAATEAASRSSSSSSSSSTSSSSVPPISPSSISDNDLQSVDWNSIPKEYGGKRVVRPTRTGFVVSTKMDKTIVVEVSRYRWHKRYQRMERRIKKYHAHDEHEECNEGDQVEIELLVRKVSKKKVATLKRIIKANPVLQHDPYYQMIQKMRVRPQIKPKVLITKKKVFQARNQHKKTEDEDGNEQQEKADATINVVAETTKTEVAQA